MRGKKRGREGEEEIGIKTKRRRKRGVKKRKLRGSFVISQCMKGLASQLRNA